MKIVTSLSRAVTAAVGDERQQQVLGQLLGRGEVVHVDEGVPLDEVLVVLPGRAQHHGHRAHGQRVVQLLRDVVLVDGVLERQVELAAGHGGEVVLVRDVLPEGLSVRVHLDVLVQLVVVLHPHVVLVPVAHDPADQLVFAGRDKVLLALRRHDGPVRHFDVSILTVIESQVEQVLDPGQLGGVRRRLQVHPYPLLGGRSLQRRQVGQGHSQISRVVTFLSLLLEKRFLTRSVDTVDSTGPDNQLRSVRFSETPCNVREVRMRLE
ncbi:hypothetical protein EYF80_052714 [Liparis tanakae]|uniref:Uncharacterized protein n=1 Tax=Liparis tanakae TaxID=230148 RepID=A0A4Z2F7K2_9TELE|nr:hypothetical protein EYF80_052714 [Liparis tanakae]